MASQRFGILLTKGHANCLILVTFGWTEDLQIKWINFPFPAEEEEILFDAEDDAFYGEEEESDEEDETD